MSSRMGVVYGGMLAGLLLTGMVGCQRPATLPNPMPVAMEAYEPVYEASIDVLRGAGFRIAQRDYRFGRVSTDPKGSPTIIEFWIGDNTTLGQGMHSTLSDLRRIVRIEFEAWDEQADRGERNSEADGAATAGLNGGVNGDQDGDQDGNQDGNAANGLTPPIVAETAAAYGVRVEVTMQRRQVPVRRMTGSVQTGVFSELDAVPGEWAARGIRRSYWESIGRDHHLEQRLLRRIAARASKSAATADVP